jgi:urease accessory protein
VLCYDSANFNLLADFFIHLSLMQINFFSKLSVFGFGSKGFLLTVALPFLFLLAFLSQQLSSFDGIGWVNGFSHPLMGWDHLVTMLAVGIWAAQLRGHAVWQLPLAFVAVMSLGGVAGASGLDIPSVEGIILLSCAVFSVLITRKVRFSGKINVLIVAFFAFFHGFAHGQEISTSASLISYTLGFMLATLLLHGAGILVAKLVVLAVSALLGMVLSNAAMANSAELMIEKQQKQVRTVEVNLNHYASIDESIQAQNPTVSATLITPQTDYWLLSSPPDNDVSTHGFVQWFLSADDRSTHVGVFRHYFPDINYTPGQAFLSSGVGLTSPPDRAVLAIKFVYRFASFAIESPVFQSAFAKTTIGNSATTPLNSLITDDAKHRLSLTFALNPSFFVPTSLHPLVGQSIQSADFGNPSFLKFNLSMLS